MTTRELIEAIQRADKRGECTVRIGIIGERRGIGNSYASYPTIQDAWRGIDWEHGEFVLRPSFNLKRAAKREKR